MLCVSPLALGVSGAVTGWYVHAYYAAPGSAAPPDALLWLADWIWVFGFPPLATALLLLFPDGRLPSRRWWPAGALVVVVLALPVARLCLRARADRRLPAGREPARDRGRPARRRRRCSRSGTG